MASLPSYLGGCNMFGRMDFAALMKGLKDPETGEFSSNVQLTAIGSAFVTITIGLIVLQPGYPADQFANGELLPQDLTDAPSAVVISADGAAYDGADDGVVTRSNTSLFSVGPDPVQRDPIRLSSGDIITYDLRGLTATVLTDFGHVTRPGDRLHSLLVETLSAQEPENYIDTVLNAAAGRGEFLVPVSLQTVDGGLDTETLLQAIKVRSKLN
ncbi:hypothetical protein [Ascidiaceihabitans sp.]|uniref:hypothetical protein n=1 Tax=Ascidiaceihabitans sp. TaxID=1872644 RepID=UPI0032970A80